MAVYSVFFSNLAPSTVVIVALYPEKVDGFSGRCGVVGCCRRSNFPHFFEFAKLESVHVPTEHILIRGFVDSGKWESMKRGKRHTQCAAVMLNALKLFFLLFNWSQLVSI